MISYHSVVDSETEKLLKEHECVNSKHNNYDIESLESTDELSMTIKDKIIQDGTKIGIDTTLMVDDILKYLKHAKEDGYDKVPYSALTAYGKIDKMVFEQIQMARQITLLEKKLEDTYEIANRGIRKADFVHKENKLGSICSVLGILIGVMALLFILGIIGVLATVCDITI